MQDIINVLANFRNVTKAVQRIDEIKPLVAGTNATVLSTLKNICSMILDRITFLSAIRIKPTRSKGPTRSSETYETQSSVAMTSPRYLCYTAERMLLSRSTNMRQEKYSKFWDCFVLVRPQRFPKQNLEAKLPNKAFSATQRHMSSGTSIAFLNVKLMYLYEYTESWEHIEETLSPKEEEPKLPSTWIYNSTTPLHS
ncbi:hypothetical protein CHS0354_014336 [Potamilus streckersoni]|uniref:Uncharacterized protein n=1 Tax=Potamilus streckersoni TaxID=2493646 RepID=A0AAE0SL93_9BIVA|nr:hypothetical protein CHS0354_014336 [Potamilus streckersoni]